MGVHDFVDFVQRNGQYLLPLELSQREPEFAGANEAVIVMIDKKYSKPDILYWPLREFAKFPKVKVGYSWDNWNFKELQGYSGVLVGKEKWWDRAIWESPSAPGVYLVNFEPNTYDAFVLGHFTPDQVPQFYLDEVFSNRPYKPKNRKHAIEKILNSGIENLLEYYGVPVNGYVLSFDDIMDSFNKGEFQAYYVDNNLQGLATKGNTLMGFLGKDGRTYYGLVRWDSFTKNIYPPV